MNAAVVGGGTAAQPSPEFWNPVSAHTTAPNPSSVPVGHSERDAAPRLHLDASQNLEQRLGEILAARNPFLEASKPLLRALADMPDQLDESGMLGWRKVLEEEIQTFGHLCDQANLRRDHMLGIRYALCTALDEAASIKPWAGGEGHATGPWSSHALLQTFHQEGDGGQKVFLLIGRLAASPRQHLQALEVMHHILGLGFEGHYRTQADGRRMLETVRHHLYTLLAEHREAVPRELSPHASGSITGKFRLIRSVPVWVTATVLGLLLLALFSWFKYQLAHQRLALEASIRAIGAQVPPANRLRLKELLSQEIAAGRVSVDEDEQQSRVLFRGDDMFLPGRAELNPRSAAVLDKVAGGINEVAGPVDIIGHTDNLPIATPEFPSNKALSEKRAGTVASMLRARGVDPGRLSISGAGDTQPLADNHNAAGRARNRRVEIVVRAH